MSGNPDVLEYYQSKNSKKPIRIIDLKECEVEMLNGQLRIKRDFHGKHLFVVKTSSRIFYLVAKTEEEMNGWISSISQICHFGSLEDAGKHTERSNPTQFEDVSFWNTAAWLKIVIKIRIRNKTVLQVQKIHYPGPEQTCVTCPHTGSGKMKKTLENWGKPNWLFGFNVRFAD